MTEPIDYFEGLPDAEEAEPATLERLTLLAKDARDLETEINADTVALEEKKERLTKILREKIPTIMDELGMDFFRLKDGAEISVKDDVKCNISEERKPVAFTWLEAHDFDGIIKTLVSVSFGKGEIEKARKALEILNENGFIPELDRNVHPSTLKAFVKEQLEAGNADLPLATFGVFEFRVAKIKPPKTK